MILLHCHDIAAAGVTSVSDHLLWGLARFLFYPLHGGLQLLGIIAVLSHVHTDNDDLLGIGGELHVVAGAIPVVILLHHPRVRIGGADPHLLGIVGLLLQSFYFLQRFLHALQLFLSAPLLRGPRLPGTGFIPGLLRLAEFLHPLPRFFHMLGQGFLAPESIGARRGADLGSVLGHLLQIH